jgi:trimeric autotransporter adhesin
MNKITLDLFLAKSKTAIGGLFVLVAFLLMNTQTSWGQVNITPIRTDVSGFTAWTDNVVAGTTYLQLAQATSSTISPAMDFNGYTTETLNFKARTFGGVNATENAITVWISTDNGGNWTSLGTRTPTSTTLTAQTAFDLSTYNGTQVKVRFTVAGTSNSIGAGIDDITITGIVFSSGPEINVKGNSISIVDGATPASITNATDFGTVATSTNVTKTYTIENTGSSDLVLTSPYVQKTLSTSVYTITQPALTTIPGGGSTTFSVTFNSAAAGTFNEGIEVLSNDIDEAVYNFDIKAVAETPVPNISVKGNSTIIVVGDATPSTTDNTDFGSTATNMDVVKTYTIENTGTGALTVTSVLMLNVPTKYIIGGITLPATIPAAGSTTFTVTFNSALAGTFADTVVINNNDPTDTSYNFAVTAQAANLNFTVGDISIVGVTADTADSFSFVNWVAIPVGAQLSFTDNAWTGTALNTNENILVWENNTGNTIPVGTVVYIYDNTSSAIADLGTIKSGNLTGISSSNENIFIYEGPSTSPNFIYGLSNLAWITTGLTNTNNSYLPAVLNVTNGNIVTGEFDNVEYSGSLAPKDEKSSFAGYKTLVNNPVNWTKNDTRFSLNSTDFELAAVWEAATWTDAVVPSSSVKTIINDTYNTTTSGSFTAKSLTVSSGKTVTVATGTSVTVESALVNNGTITVENNANLRQTAVANTNSGSGTATVKRNSAALKRLDYTMWSSPVSGSQTLEGFSPNTSRTPNRFYTYNGGTAFATIATTSTFDAGKGYLIRMPNDAANDAAAFAGQFTGTTFNNGTITVSGLTSDKFYSVGNPYPSTLDAAAFLVANPGTLYFWRKTNGASGGAYATYNSVGPVATGSGAGSDVPDGTIQVGQGFIAKTGVAASTLVFTNAMRLGTTTAQFFKTKNTAVKSRVWLDLTATGGVFSQALVGYLDGATLGIDNGFDGKYLNDSPADAALTSIVDGGEYTIQGRPAFDVTDVVALGFKTGTAGDYTIAINKKDGALAAQDIYLVDSKTGIETDLNAGSYTFNAAAGVDNTRFSLKYQKTLKADAPAFNDNSVKVYKNNGAIYVNSTAKTIKTIEVYDVQGRLIAQQKNVNATTATIQNVKAIRQMLIVKVSADDNSVVSKKVLN